MNPRLRRLLETLRRLTDAGSATPFPSRLGDELARRVGLAVAEVVRAGLAGAVAAALDRPVPRGASLNDPQPLTGDCHCPTWQQLGDALAAASLAAGPVPNGRPVAVALGALSAVADLIARAQSARDPNT
jgi:hypothetical protein